VGPERIAVRAVIAFVFLLALLRLAGKRSVHQGTNLEVVLGLVMGDLVDDLLWAEVPFSQFVVAAGVLALCETSLKAIVAASRRIRDEVSGRALVILRDGVPLEPCLAQERMALDEAEAMLRNLGIPRERWRELKSARVEVNGRPSALCHDWARPAPRAEADRLPRGT
jgi:uncharacterized membrane protein YcaP (DUF421 family)